MNPPPGPARPPEPDARAADGGRRWLLVAGIAGVLFTVVAVLTAAHGWAPYPFERAANDWSVTHRPAAARNTAVALTWLGSGVVPYLLALAAGAVTLRAAPAPRSPRRAVLQLTGPVLWLIAGQLLRLGVMHACGRPRPPRMNWATDASGFSFPSGHSFTATVSAGLLALAVARARPARAGAAIAGAAVFAVAIGLTRVYLGVHWPLDVLGGWLLAAGWLAAGAVVLRPGPPHRRRTPGSPTDHHASDRK
ncbi:MULTISPECIES: phosphatase PAP2 family protein [unclassified Kitasatospora]|uniref:phosphatase PAP2 family protein n=1 Tax=unclassified Kitasatospora TaxID=2633591 RepID=UPI0033C98EE8